MRVSGWGGGARGPARSPASARIFCPPDGWNPCPRSDAPPGRVSHCPSGRLLFRSPPQIRPQREGESRLGCSVRKAWGPLSPVSRLSGSDARVPCAADLCPPPPSSAAASPHHLPPRFSPSLPGLFRAPGAAPWDSVSAARRPTGPRPAVSPSCLRPLRPLPAVFSSVPLVRGCPSSTRRDDPFLRLSCCLFS